MSDRYQEAMALFTKVRSPEDINLIAEVRRCLDEAGLNQERCEVFDKDWHVTGIEDKLPEVQRHFLNMYWNRQIVTTGKPAYEERLSLVPNGSFEDWVRLFKTNVIPFCVTHRLPRSYNGIA